MNQAIQHSRVREGLGKAAAPAAGNSQQFLIFLRRHLRLLRWLVPTGLLLLVVIYEASASSWMLRTMGQTPHTLLDTFVFGILGPALAFLLIDFVDRYLQERETSDLQAQLLAQVQDDAQASRQLSDDAVQVLYVAGALIDTLKACQPEMTEETVAQIEASEEALDRAIENLRHHLMG